MPQATNALKHLIDQSEGRTLLIDQSKNVSKLFKKNFLKKIKSKVNPD